MTLICMKLLFTIDGHSVQCSGRCMHHNTAESKVLPKHRMPLFLRGSWETAADKCRAAFTQICKIMMIFDRNLTKNEALKNPQQFMINSQISSFGTGTGPQSRQKMWNCSAFREELQNKLEICFEVSRTLFALLNNF